MIVVNPRKKTVAFHRSPTDMVVFKESDAIEGGDVAPGWRMPIRELFQ